jgi:hypothetical protein
MLQTPSRPGQAVPMSHSSPGSWTPLPHDDTVEVVVDEVARVEDVTVADVTVVVDAIWVVVA